MGVSLGICVGFTRRRVCCVAADNKDCFSYLFGRRSTDTLLRVTATAHQPIINFLCVYCWWKRLWTSVSVMAWRNETDVLLVRLKIFFFSSNRTVGLFCFARDRKGQRGQQREREDRMGRTWAEFISRARVPVPQYLPVYLPVLLWPFSRARVRRRHKKGKEIKTYWIRRPLSSVSNSVQQPPHKSLPNPLEFKGQRLWWWLMLELRRG